MSRLFGKEWPAQFVAFLDPHVAVARVGSFVSHFKTDRPPSARRELLPDDRERPLDPPNPLELVRSHEPPPTPTRPSRGLRRKATIAG
jgi:hypothetical protein